MIRVLREDVPRTRNVLIDNARVDRCSIGGDVDWSGAECHRAGEEGSRRGAIAAFGDEDVDHLAVLVDRAVEVGPAAGDLDVCFIDEPAISCRVSQRARSVDEFGRERLHPPIDRHVIHHDGALGQQLLHIAVGQSVPQIPAHRDRNHFAREPVAGWCGRVPRLQIDHPDSLPIATGCGQRNSAELTSVWA